MISEIKLGKKYSRDTLKSLFGEFEAVLTPSLTRETLNGRTHRDNSLQLNRTHGSLGGSEKFWTCSKFHYNI